MKKQIGIVGHGISSTIAESLIKDPSYEFEEIAREYEEYPFSYSRTLPPIVREGKKIGRNDKCTCGSGLKFKKCCLRK